MSSTAFDSFLYREMFSTAAMREVFSDTAFVAAMTDTETALARAQAKVGVIPHEAAENITARVRPDDLDHERLRVETENIGYPVLPLVTQLAEQCGDAGGYLHWGATTQDIMDTATVTAGRTHLQHALPVTFGFRAAVWVSALDRHAERLAAARQRDLMVQFGGAAGPLASLGTGPDGLSVRAALATELGLRDPEITWHVARDGLNEIIAMLAAIGASLGKIGSDVMMMCSSEFGELAEPFVPGRGASSTMPQKRNPISSELMVAAAKLLRDRASSMLDAMMADFERATGPWHLEWVTVPEAFHLVASSLHQAQFMLDGLQVNTDHMRNSTNLTGGLIVAEAVMMALAPSFGRQDAHEIVYDACRHAIEHRSDLATELRRHPDLLTKLGADRIGELCDPAGYLGSARAMTYHVVGQQPTRSEERRV